MKLIELHIRNIASIEKADIDFEHGLIDTVTGSPASIFLISGDTGAGKSVILDGISMALYKKTPRLADVANSSKNDYTDAEGESIRVASIEQYTRLGISEKDESYSEVVFEGNDGKTYHARLTLGMLLGNRDKTTGIRPLKHKTPKWEIRTENGDWTKDSVEQTILQAVGLDFQQFGRMAMLAQGQFANFLTGDKKEREAILEQLTNTQHFTAYGEAIQSLFKKAKEEQTLIQTKYDAEKHHTLTDEEVERLTQLLQSSKLQKEQFDQTIKSIDDRLKLTETVLNSEKTLVEATQKKQELEMKRSGEEYQGCKALYTDWDDTTQQREQLANLLRARQDEQRAEDELKKMQATFGLLAADLADRQLQAQNQDELIGQQRVWLAARKQHAELFAKAGEVDLKITQYVGKMRKSDELLVSLNMEKAKTEGLRKAEAEAKSAAEAAENTVRQRQEGIDQLNSRRAGLNLQAVMKELKNQHVRRQQLKELQASIVNLQTMTEEQLRLQQDIQSEEALIAAQKVACQQVDADYQSRKLDAERASRRLNTMEMSLDKKIKELRHKLYEEHSECCPLCGQHIDQIHLDDDFKNMLTPLEEEAQQAAEALRCVAALRDEVMGKLSRLNGAHQNKKSQQAAYNDKIMASQQSIDKKADALGLDLQVALSQQISDAIGQQDTAIASLEQTQRDAERLQEEINHLIEEKKPFDKKKAEAEKTKVKAETEVTTNLQSIVRLEREHEELVAESETVKGEISNALVGYCTDWLTDIDALRSRLRTEAKAYNEQLKLLDAALAKQEKDTAMLASLTQIQQSILLTCPEWAFTPVAQAYACRSIHTEWTGLLGSVTSLSSRIKNCRSVIESADSALTAYYLASGKTEQSLCELMAKECRVAEARRIVGETDAQLKSRNDAIVEAERQIEACFLALRIDDRTELPDKQLLEEEKKSTSALRDEVLAQMAQAQSRLNMHFDNIRQLKEIEAQLDAAKLRFTRWDRLNSIFGGTRFRTLVQTYILRPLLNNANIYLEQITDRYRLTCSEANEQLSILVLDRYNKDQVRSVTVLSGGERFMISLALSLALSSLNQPDMNVNILFIDEGFGTLDEKSLDSVMSTLEKLQEIAGQTNRRVGIISHREELNERIAVKIQVMKKGEGRSMIEISR